jgi:predicted deacylase
VGISVEVTTPTKGIVFAREAARLARAGAWIAMVAGTELLAAQGTSLLLD